MDRRHFLQLLLSALAAPELGERKSAPVPTARAVMPTIPGTCGICGSSNYVWDHWLDFHICLNCGAHETAIGWQAR
jgi:hypothetical protein